MVVQKAITNYLEWKAIRSPKAAIVYEHHIRRMFKYCKVTDTKQLNDQDIVTFNHKLSKKLNPPGIAYSCRVLRNFFRYLNSVQQSTVNPFLIQEPKYPRKQRIGVTDEEFKAMCSTLNQWETADLQKLTILQMLYDTGVRVSELCDLNIEQISSTENYTSIETKKNKQTRWIMWSKDFHQNTLLRWLGSRICINKKPNLFLSLEKNCGSKRIPTRTVERWVKNIAIKAGITKPITPHMFRHAKAHRMKASGADLKDIQMMLGHVSPFSALIYLNFDKNEMLTNAQKYLQPAYQLTSK